MRREIRILYLSFPLRHLPSHLFLISLPLRLLPTLLPLRPHSFSFSLFSHYIASIPFSHHNPNTAHVGVLCMTMIIGYPPQACLIESPKLRNLKGGLDLHELRDTLIASICIIILTHYYPEYSTNVRDNNEEALGIEC